VPPAKGDSSCIVSHKSRSTQADLLRYNFFTQDLSHLGELALGADRIYLIQKICSLVGDEDCDIEVPELGEGHRFLLMLKNNLAFYLENVGMGHLLLNGHRLNPGQTALLPTDYVIQCGECFLVFLPNWTLLGRLRTNMEHSVGYPGDTGRE
jgi:hypothetical protein